MRTAWALLLALAAPASAQEAPPSSSVQDSPPAASVQAAPAGALACTGCHGLHQGAPFPIHQLSAEQIAAAMAAFRDGSRAGTIMPRLAGAFTDDEAGAIATWFAAQGDAQ